MFNLLLAVLLLALLLCSTSAQTVFRTSYFISRNRSVRGRDIDCKGRNEQGKLVDYCREVRAVVINSSNSALSHGQPCLCSGIHQPCSGIHLTTDAMFLVASV